MEGLRGRFALPRLYACDALIHGPYESNFLVSRLHFLEALGIHENAFGDSVHGQDLGPPSLIDAREIGAVIPDEVGNGVDLVEVQHVLYIEYTIEFYVK